MYLIISFHAQDESSAGGKDEIANVDPWMKAAKEVCALHSSTEYTRICADVSLCRSDLQLNNSQRVEQGCIFRADIPKPLLSVIPEAMSR